MEVSSSSERRELWEELETGLGTRCASSCCQVKHLNEELVGMKTSVPTILAGEWVGVEDDVCWEDGGFVFNAVSLCCREWRLRRWFKRGWRRLDSSKSRSAWTITSFRDLDADVHDKGADRSS